jgi:hypothetical protein
MTDSGHHHSSARNSLLNPLQQFWPVAVGTGLAGVTIIVSELSPPEFALDLHALVLVFIAAPYAGFASIDGGQREMVIEFAGIACFCALAVGGLWLWHPLWVIGYVGHGLWDVLHHPHHRFGATVVGWYIPFCFYYGILVGGYLFFVFVVSP